MSSVYIWSLEFAGDPAFREQAIFTGKNETYEAYEKDIAVLNIYFDIPTVLVIINYVTKQRMFTDLLTL